MSKQLTPEEFNAMMRSLTGGQYKPPKTMTGLMEMLGVTDYKFDDKTEKHKPKD